MVYALLIHSTTSTRDVYFAIFYTPEGNDERRKPRQQMIIQRVLQEQAALQAALGATLSHHGAEKEGILTDRGMHTASGLSSASVASSTPPLGSASKRQPQASEGAQRLLPSTFISEQHLLLWRIVGRLEEKRKTCPIKNYFTISNLHYIMSAVILIHTAICFPRYKSYLHNRDDDRANGSIYVHESVLLVCIIAISSCFF
eukprot:GHVT01069745.1.p1 GENE.GHVT01069745.1~~GHVT01069745.1.p1  ORF type:complete len:201 (+),score=7.99 GHVT01069745.1:116-718(+)